VCLAMSTYCLHLFLCCYNYFRDGENCLCSSRGQRRLLKENIELDQDELDMMFERTPNYVEVTEQVRIDLHCYEQVSLERNKKLIIDLHIYLFV
jgi:hypothetical protein